MPSIKDSPIQTQIAVVVLDGALTGMGSVFNSALDKENNVHTLKKKMQMALKLECTH